jgi:error-prone DNA polymerase
LPFTLSVLCETAEGYRNLCRLITAMKLRSPKGEGALTFDDLDGRTSGLMALVGGAALEVSRFGVGGLLDRVLGLFGRDHVSVEVQRHFQRDQEAGNQALMAMASAFRVPVVATGGVRFATSAERPLFDVLTCIHHHTTLSAAGRRLGPNAERYLRPPEEMTALFADCPAAIAHTHELADRLQYTMADLGYRFPDYPVPPGETQASFLRRLTEVGARDRYRPFHDRARAQITRELDLIEKLDLAGYFLIVWDIVNFCRQHDILVQGRGSAANSAVCYSLGITAVDPVGMDLLFERFLSEERGAWPDIDLDLPSGDRRERVIQHVYEKYGRHGAAMTANVITYRGRSAAREVGRALEFEPAEIDRLARVINHFEFTDAGDSLPRHLAAARLDPESDRVRLFARLWEQMQDLPRHLGQHSGGMVICQGQLDAVVPLENASMAGRVVVQWDKDDCADMGIVKVDLLGLGMMAALQDTLTLVNASTLQRQIPAPCSVSPEHPGASVCSTLERSSRHPAASVPSTIDLASLPPDDPAVYHLLCEADTVGVFQVESRAQMATLPRLKPATFYDLVVQVAIIRPGPIVGQMVHPYLNRRAGREEVRYPHPSLEPILKRTLGVPLFQEQLLRIAMVAAGFTGGQAEELRRALGFKRSEQRMAAIVVHLREGMARQGITGAAADEIITSIRSFALYGFPESHAASFALLAYASAWFKVHYPAAFVTALLNNQPMGFYHPSTLVKDAQRRGVRFHPVDVQASDWNCTIEADGAVRLGLRYVNGLREEAGRALVAVRARSASPRQAPGFSSLDDLVARAGLRRDEMATLADIGALNALGGDRRSALWQAEQAVRPAGALYENWELGIGNWELNAPPSPLSPMTDVERLVADYAGTGLTLGRHPMSFCRGDLALRGVLRALDLRTAREGRRVRVAGMVITRQRPGTAKGFLFLTLEDETGVANVIVRPDLFTRDRLVLVQAPFLLVDGILQNQDGVTSVRAEAVQAMPGPLTAVDAHNFH